MLAELVDDIAAAHQGTLPCRGIATDSSAYNRAQVVTDVCFDSELIRIGAEDGPERCRFETRAQSDHLLPDRVVEFGTICLQRRDDRDRRDCNLLPPLHALSGARRTDQASRQGR